MTPIVGQAAGVAQNRAGGDTGRQIQIREVAGVPIFVLDERIFLRSSRILKRAIDLILGICALIFLSPIWILTSIFIRLGSKGSIILKQTRIGKRAQPFPCFKFRSMRPDADAMQDQLEHLNEAQGPLFKIRNDPRITRVGRVIRKFSIDELPQLINILKGDMSFVGPRPPIPREVDKYERWQRRRLRMKPGLTCLWQIRGRNEIDFEEWMKLDLQYIDSWSVLLDLKIVLKTIPIVLLGKGT